MCSKRLAMGMADSGAVPGCWQSAANRTCQCALVSPPPHVTSWDAAGAHRLSRDVCQGRENGTAWLGLHTHPAKSHSATNTDVHWQLTTHTRSARAACFCITQDHVGRVTVCPAPERNRENSKVGTHLILKVHFWSFLPNKPLSLRSRNWIS